MRWIAKAANWPIIVTLDNHWAKEDVMTLIRNSPTKRAGSAALVRYVVRRGVGSMPRLTPTDLTDEDLARVAQWLETGR